MASRSEQFLRSERHLGTAIATVQEEIAKVERALDNEEGNAKVKGLAREATAALTMAKQNYRRLETALNNMKSSEQVQYRGKCDTYKEQIEGLETRLREIRTATEKNDLFGARRSGESSQQQQRQDRGNPFQTEEQEDQRLMTQTLQSMERSNNYLTDSQQVLGQTEEIGINVLSNLNDQRESLLRANNKVKQTNSAAKDAKVALSRMARRACYNTLVLYTIILLLIAAIILIIYVKFIK